MGRRLRYMVASVALVTATACFGSKEPDFENVRGQEIQTRLVKRTELLLQIDKAGSLVLKMNLLSRLVREGSVSQLPFEFDLFVIGALSDIARNSDAETAKHAIHLLK